MSNSQPNLFTYFVLDDYMPWSSCSNQFQGFEYELLNKGLSDLQQSEFENFNYTFKCVTDTNNSSVLELFQQYLQSPLATLFGGLTINSDRIKSGYMFSIPTYQDNLVALSYSANNNEFALSSFMDLNSTLSFFFSLMLVGLLLLLYEKNINRDYSQNLFFSMLQGFWHSYLIIFRMGHKIISFQAKCLQITMVFTALFLIMLLGSSIIISYKKDNFTQLMAPSQLAGSQAYTIHIYYDIVLSYGMSINQADFTDDDPAEDVITGLPENKFDFVITDASVLTNIAQNNCAYQISTIDFFQFNMGVAMKRTNENNDLLRITNRAIALAKNDTTYFYSLIQKHFVPASSCNVGRKAFFENGEAITDNIDYTTFLTIFFVLISILIVAAIAKLFESKMRVFLKKKKELNELIKMSSGVEAEILKKISIFFELLTTKWMNILKNFEEEQANLMEKERNCKFLVHEIYNKAYSFFNPNINNSFEKNLLESKIAQSAIKNTNIFSASLKKSKFLNFGPMVKKRESNFAIFEDFSLGLEENDENDETDKEEREQIKQE